MDPIVQFKEQQKVSWPGFEVLENLTGTVSPRLVRFAGITKGAEVLDVACGSGVAALTAARLGARVTGVDLTPELIARARENAAIMKLEATWHEGDVEQLPVGDAKFDFVVSQFGHIFAPRPEVAVREMLRVLKPGGTIAFATWPPELLTGRMLAINGKYAPPPPPGVAPPPQWGDPNVVRERLGAAVRDITFTRGVLYNQTLSPQHSRLFMENNFRPLKKLLGTLDASDPQKAASLRRELDELGATYFEDNCIHQHYLLTRAVKV
jgi:ubiquinone/menaquinone biosynthesis C-methylase UbiE